MMQWFLLFVLNIILSIVLLLGRKRRVVFGMVRADR